MKAFTPSDSGVKPGRAAQQLAHRSVHTCSCQMLIQCLLLGSATCSSLSCELPWPASAPCAGAGTFMRLTVASAYACGLQVGASDNLDSQATALTQKYIKVADPCTFRLIAKNVVNILPVNKKQLKEDTYKELDELIRWAVLPSRQKGANNFGLSPWPLKIKPPSYLSLLQLL